MQNLLWWLLLLEGFVFLSYWILGPIHIHVFRGVFMDICPWRGGRKKGPPLCRIDCKNRWSVTLSRWMIQAGYVHVCFVRFSSHYKRIGISHHVTKLASIAVSIIFIRFSVFLRRLFFFFWGRGVIQSFILNETGWCQFCPPVHRSLEIMILFISHTSWLGASFRTEAAKLPICGSLVNGSGVSRPVTKEGREGSDCWAQQSRSVSESFRQITCKWVSCMTEGSLRILLCSWFKAMWSFNAINVCLWWKPQRWQAAHGALALEI